MNQAREILSKFWGNVKRVLPAYKPRHVDRLAAMRRKRFASVQPRGPFKTGWKRFYRENYDHIGLKEMRRKRRRAILKEWYRSRR